MSLVVSDLSFGYGAVSVLRHISFEAKEAELTAVLGPNGVGKTTLFQCILGNEKKYTGRITVNGQDLRRLTPRQQAHLVASIPQVHSVNFRYSAFDMVLMGTTHAVSPLAVPGEAERAAARAAMEKLGIGWLAERPFDQLSGGEQQLIYIARALAQNARILLMDEPTSSLDYGNQFRVLDVVRSLASEGYTILLSTHNPQHALWYADRALALQGGCVYALGAPQEVITPSLIEKLYGWGATMFEGPTGPVLVPQGAQ